jgi:hypothetical protein
VDAGERRRRLEAARAALKNAVNALPPTAAGAEASAEREVALVCRLVDSLAELAIDSRIRSAGLVHTYGRGFSFQVSIHARMSALSARTDW